MKSFSILFGPVILSVVVLFSACAGVPFKPASFEPGVYEGSGQGFRGPIRVRVLTVVSGIEDIEILEHNEDEAVGGAALEELRELVLEYGTLDAPDIDAVSGATYSCRGFLEALENALVQPRTDGKQGL